MACQLRASQDASEMAKQRKAAFDGISDDGGVIGITHYHLSSSISNYLSSTYGSGSSTSGSALPSWPGPKAAP